METNLDKLVRDAFKIDEGELCSREGTSDYWTSAYGFYYDVRFKKVDALTIQQYSWLKKIERQLEKESYR